MNKTTHIGSLPFKDLNIAIEFNKLFNLPVLSTLPLLDKNEYMINQVLGGIKNYKYQNYKINLEDNYELVDYKFNFCLEQKFITEFSGKSIKWQIIGICTLLKSIENIAEINTNDLISWHLKNIIHYQKYLETKFKHVSFFLDEPMFNDISDKIILVFFINSLKKAGIKVHMHCCGKITRELIAQLPLEGLSFDCTQLVDIGLDELKESFKELFIGILDTQTLEIITDIRVHKSNFFTPTCGLAYSDPKKVLNIPNILNNGTNCS